MFTIRTRPFEFAVEFGGMYLRLGRRDWRWSREAGLSGLARKCAPWRTCGEFCDTLGP